MSNKNLWLLLSGVVAACSSFFCCLFGVVTLMGATTYETEFGGTTSQGTMNPASGLLFLCLGLLPWLLPAGVWFYFRRKEDQLPPPSTGSFGPTAGSAWNAE